jgi:hypothetical protein
MKERPVAVGVSREGDERMHTISKVPLAKGSIPSLWPQVTIVLIISLLDIYVIDTSMRSTEDSFLFTTFTLVVNLVVFIRYLVIVRASVSKQVRCLPLHSYISSTKE